MKTAESLVDRRPILWFDDVPVVTQDQQIVEASPAAVHSENVVERGRVVAGELAPAGRQPRQPLCIAMVAQQFSTRAKFALNRATRPPESEPFMTWSVGGRPLIGM